MAERRVGIRELKSRLSEYVREVSGGATIVVTDHGRPVARMIADASSLDERLEALASTGRILWSGRRLKARTPVARVRGSKSVADLISENRE